MKKILSLILVLMSITLVIANNELPKGKSMTTITMEDQPVTKSKLYPNPATDFTVIQNTSSIKIKNISVLSMVGSYMINKEILDNNASQEINVSRLPSGRYFVKVAYLDGTMEVLTLIKI